LEAWRIRISGRVQGVGFRYYALRKAQEMSIAGWVRNLPDGDVEIHAEGAVEALSAFLSAVRQGPPFAMVTDVSFRKVPVENCPSFTIRG